jgi:hypothetical protein
MVFWVLGREPDVSEEYVILIFRVEDKQETSRRRGQAQLASSLAYFLTLKTEVSFSPKRRAVSELHIATSQGHRHDSLKSNK